jgi:6-phosphogluconolactonase
MSVEIKTFATRRAQMPALADQVAGDLRAALLQQGRASLAVPGGTTPEPFLSALAEQALDWEKVHATLTDERWLPPSHVHSNERLLRGSLLTKRAAAAIFLPLYVDVPVPEQGLVQIAEALEVVWPLDVCVLGMGTDGHTASLFPGADRLDEALDPDCPEPVLPMRAPGAPEPRITLTLPVLAAAAQTHLLITGNEKRAVLERALEDGPVREMPIRAILRGPSPVTVFHAP